jgi:hypothetical protein
VQAEKELRAARAELDGQDHELELQQLRQRLASEIFHPVSLDVTLCFYSGTLPDRSSSPGGGPAICHRPLGVWHLKIVAKIDHFELRFDPKTSQAASERKLAEEQSRGREQLAQSLEQTSAEYELRLERARDQADEQRRRHDEMRRDLEERLGAEHSRQLQQLREGSDGTAAEGQARITELERQLARAAADARDTREVHAREQQQLADKLARVSDDVPRAYHVLTT